MINKFFRFLFKTIVQYIYFENVKKINTYKTLVAARNLLQISPDSTNQKS